MIGMKTKHLLLIMIITALLFSSCNLSKSPVEPISVEPVVDISLTTKRDTIGLGDTLHLTIHNNAKKYSSIILDLRRAIITFNNHFTDTTISFVYDWSSEYNISLSLVDGDSVIKKLDRKITVLPHYFSLHFSVGMIWKYSYNYYDSYPPTSTSIRQNGIHIWEIISSEISNQDTIYSVRQIRDDIKNDNGVSKTIKDTTISNFTVSPTTISINWQFYGGMRNFSFSNNTFVNRLPIRPSDYVSIDDKVGPKGYYYYNSASHGLEVKEEFVLLDFYKP